MQCGDLIQTDARRDVLEQVARRISALPRNLFARIAIDGVDGAGKTTFADELALALVPTQRPIIRASVDGFHNPRAIRYRLGRNSPEGFFLDSYDYMALRQNLLDPLSPSGSGQYRTAVFDHVQDSPIAAKLEQALSGSVLVLDGIFLHRPELREFWDLSVFLHVKFEVSIPRGAARGPGFGSPDPLAESNHRYIEGQLRYLRECAPQTLATISIDNTNLFAPRIIIAGDQSLL